MKTKIRILLSLVSVGILSLACSLLATPTAPPVATQPPIQVEPTIPPATELPQTVNVSSLPAGLATANDNVITFYDQNGVQVSQVALPQQTFPGRGRIHLAGPMPDSGGVVPLLYFTFENEEALHYRDGNGQIFSLLSGNSFLGLTGVPGEPIVAFSQGDFMDSSMRSKIYAGALQTLDSAAPVSVIDDPESWAIKPLVVDTRGDTLTKVWYTRIAYGIGGDIVFEPRKGLFVLDLATGQASTLLDNSVSPWAVSTDRNWVAYASPNVPPNSMCLKNLGSGTEVCFPALAASEPRGAGDALLSPDAGYVTWMEGDGWQMAEVPSFTATVRIGQSDGAVVADLPMSNFEAAAGIGTVSRAEPVGWLDDQALIIQVRGQEWNQVALLSYNVGTGETSYLAPGEFVGLLYP